jgi:hypothetical protein
MVVKSKAKSKKKVKAVAKVKPVAKKKAIKPVGKKSTKAPVAAKAKSIKKAMSRATTKVKSSGGPAGKSPAVAPARRRPALAEKPVEVTRTINLVNQIRQPVKSAARKNSTGSSSINSNLFNFMKAPRPEYAFEVGDTVEVFCDHEKGRERVRGWIKGIVVQVDNKMVAVQFRSNVFLTDGWMVPDRILWYPLTSEHIRPVTTGKKPVLKKDVIPDY